MDLIKNNTKNQLHRGVIFTFVIMLIFPSFVFAQKKEIAAARANIKKGTNLEEAENSMIKLLNDSANYDNEKIWLTLFDAVKKQYEQLNEKMYLKQESDTAKFLASTNHMYYVLEGLDSIDAKPNAKGEVNPKYRKEHSKYLDQYRTNLFYGGGYYMKKHNWKKAFECFNTYIDCAFQPLFSSYNYNENDTHFVEAAYWTMFCGYKLKDAAIIEKYVDIAKREMDREMYILQYLAEAYQLRNDTDNYRKTIEEGFEKYPDNSYFYPRLSIYYAKHNWYRDILRISQKVLSINPQNKLALVAVSSAYLNLSEYENCVSASESAIKCDSTIAMPYLNAGLAYYNMAQPIAKKRILSKEDKESINDLYRQALTFLVQYRRLEPKDSDTWARPLYDIYLNLNMGDEFEEMEKYVE